MGCFTGEFYAKSLRITTQIKVIFPDLSNDVDPVIFGTPKVVYLLHGLCANAGEWTRFSKIEYYAKKYNLIVIMPEVQRSFYTDLQTGINYFTYITQELPQICNKWFNLPQGKENTFIAGESMGGYGAIKAALCNPTQYAAAASLSGALDIVGLTQRVMQEQWEDLDPCEVKSIFGQNGYVQPHDDLLQIMQDTSTVAQSPKLLLLCGTEDFLYQDNITFCKNAQKVKLDYTWREAPGDHSWPYWDIAIQNAIQFFCGLDMDTTPLY